MLMSTIWRKQIYFSSWHKKIKYVLQLASFVCKLQLFVWRFYSNRSTSLCNQHNFWVIMRLHTESPPSRQRGILPMRLFPFAVLPKKFTWNPIWLEVSIFHFLQGRSSIHQEMSIELHSDTVLEGSWVGIFITCFDGCWCANISFIRA